MSKDKPQPFDDTNINELAKEIIKKELIAKVQRRLNDNDPVVLNTIRSLINDKEQKETPESKWNVKQI